MLKCRRDWKLDYTNAELTKCCGFRVTGYEKIDLDNQQLLLSAVFLRELVPDCGIKTQNTTEN